MIKVYIGTLTNQPPLEILFPNLGGTERETPFGEKVFGESKERFVDVVKEPAMADYFLLPHNYNYVKNNTDYILSFVELSLKYSKKIIVIFPGDSDETVPIPNAIVFRNSQYRYKKQDNEIMMPAYAVDLGKKYGLLERSKVEKPVVGFCGWATFKNPKGWLSYTLFNLTESLVGKRSRKRGLYYRRRAIDILKKSQKVATNFIIRSSYSGNTKTLTIDPHQARKEYIDTIKNSDFTLAPKGDGNFSVRFYEALSLGRIPLLIDTECILPLEDEIKYDDFILRITERDLPHIADKLADYYANLSPEAYIQKQKRCREVFENRT